MKARCLVLLATAIVLAPAGAADPASGLKACGALSDPAARLACYDALQQPAAASPASPPQPAAPPVEPVTPVAPPAKAAERDSSFGSESLEGRRPPAKPEDVLQAHLKQEFRGWEKGTLFELDNGQVWEAVGGDSAYYRATPAGRAVTIEKRWSGGYELEVEGYSRSIKVRRVR